MAKELEAVGISIEKICPDYDPESPNYEDAELIISKDYDDKEIIKALKKIKVKFFKGSYDYKGFFRYNRIEFEYKSRINKFHIWSAYAD